MAIFGRCRIVALLFLGAVATKELDSEGLCLHEGGSKDCSGEEEASLLQHKAQVHQEVRQPAEEAAPELVTAEGALAEGAPAQGAEEAETPTVLVQKKSLKMLVAQCPDSGEWCLGEMCCAGISASGNLTFPCPLAPEGWNNCETERPPPAHVACPSSGNMCSGNQCCPGTDSVGTFPCPTADPNWNLCQSDAPTPLLVQCPHSGEWCSGNTCCKGRPHSEGLSFPCPSADMDWNECEATAPIPLVSTLVKCPGGDNWCAGNICCPGTPDTGGKSFPCPSAGSWWNRCEGTLN